MKTKVAIFAMMIVGVLLASWPATVAVTVKARPFW